jgi:hypothetical protein
MDQGLPMLRFSAIAQSIYSEQKSRLRSNPKWLAGLGKSLAIPAACLGAGESAQRSRRLNYWAD